MKLLWCWRCRQEMPMLDESEWAEVRAAIEAGQRWLQARSAEPGQKVVGADGRQSSVTDAYHRRFGPMLEAYHRLTGLYETNPNAVWHHRVALYGPPCEGCGKPLRSPQAKLCAACGLRRAQSAAV